MDTRTHEDTQTPITLFQRNIQVKPAPFPRSGLGTAPPAGKETFPKMMEAYGHDLAAESSTIKIGTSETDMVPTPKTKWFRKKKKKKGP